MARLVDINAELQKEISIGLAYVRTLIRQLGGRVWVESKLGVGTKMKFTVPNAVR
ncbi:MAG: hypothetical protein H7X79_07355 [Sporomusaceae bacterium]|nr:hypothetical protein [Sporomusaceae bacterium]